jgi:TetR/AcrR family transcriptional regulator, cholesterol catabolism regulator
METDRASTIRGVNSVRKGSAVARRQDGTQPRASSRSKRADILRVATEIFGRDGYEHSKWADVAAEVGIGSTALYHYFESKLHCLYVIMAEALESDHEDFERITKDPDDYLEALVTVLRSLYDLSEHEVLRNRVLVSEQVLVGVHRNSPREEEARQLARARMRDLEFAWATFLARGMQHGAIPESDPRLLTRAVLGLHNSVWHWYRPRGSLPLSEVGDFYVRRCLAVLGLPAELADADGAAPPKTAAIARKKGERAPARAGSR